MPDQMGDAQAAELLSLLAEYADAYEDECDPQMTVAELAGDLIGSLPHAYAGGAARASYELISKTFPEA